MDDDDLCCVCGGEIPEDGTGVGITGVENGQVIHKSYHGSCYNAERLRDSGKKKQNNRTSKHNTLQKSSGAGTCHFGT